MDKKRLLGCVALFGLVMLPLGYGKQEPGQLRDSQEKVAVAGANATPKQEAVIFKNGELQSMGLRFKVKADVSKIINDIRSGDGGAGLSNIALDAHVKDALEGALDRSVEVLHNRLKRLGIEAPSVIKKDGMIEIQLPGVGEDKRDEVKRLILSVGFLEFRMVHPRSQELTDRLFAAGKAPAGWKIVTLEGRSYYRMADEIPAATRDEAFLQELGRFESPDPRYEFLLEEVEVQGQQVHRPCFVSRQVVLWNRDVHNASLESTGLNQPAVALELAPQGATRFGEITEQYAPGGPLNPSGERQLAIVIDGILYSAPTIREPIHSGRIQIPIGSGLNEAKCLVNIISSGALPIQLNIE